MHATVIGGGLAGSEAAWRAAESGVDVTLFEMRPRVQTPAHRTGRLAELVCSNSLKSRLLTTAGGLLKAELGLLGSVILQEAENHAVPAGSALAVDRIRFSEAVTRRIERHPRITVVRKEVKSLPPEDRATVVASGPLTSPSLANALEGVVGGEYLSFYDAISPIVMQDSIDLCLLFRAARYDKGEADYLNCPLTREEYHDFIDALVHAERFEPRPFERGKFFAACAPVEDLASRGVDTLAFGCMRPVGLVDPKTGERPHAVVQLRSETSEGTLYSLVGMQTRLRHGEQRRVFRMIPGLARAEFARYGSLHRNTFICSPRVIRTTLEHRTRKGLFLAGQLTGAEGYVESVALGWLAGHNVGRYVRGQNPLVPPRETVLGSLVRWLATSSPEGYQPMNANFGLLPPLQRRAASKRERYKQMSDRAVAAMRDWAEHLGVERDRGEGVINVEGRS